MKKYLLKKIKKTAVFYILLLTVITSVIIEFSINDNQVFMSFLGKFNFPSIHWSSKYNATDLEAYTKIPYEYKQAKLRVGFCPPEGFVRTLNQGEVFSNEEREICIEHENITLYPQDVKLYFVDGFTHQYSPNLPSCEEEGSSIDNFASTSQLYDINGNLQDELSFTIPPQSTVQNRAKIQFRSSKAGMNYGCLITTSGEQKDRNQSGLNVFIRRGSVMSAEILDSVEIVNNGRAVVSEIYTNFNSIEIITTGTGNDFSNAYIMYGKKPDDLSRRIDLSGSQDSLMGMSGKLDYQTKYYYKIYGFGTMKSYDVSDLLTFQTKAKPGGDAGPGPGMGAGGGAGGGITCNINYEYFLGSQAKSIKKSNVAILDTSTTDGLVNQPIELRICSNKYIIDIEAGTEVTYTDGSKFDGRIKAAQSTAKNLFPDPGPNASIIKAIMLGDEEGGELKFSKPFKLTVPINELVGRKVSELEKIKFYYLDNEGNYHLSGDGGTFNPSGLKGTNFGTIMPNRFALIYGDLGGEIEDEDDLKEAAPELKDFYGTLVGCGEKAGEMRFRDIEDHWGEGYISRLHELGIIHGKNTYMFYPNDNVSRAELTKIAVNGLCIKLPDPDSITEKPFLDVGLDDWHLKFIQAAKNVGMMIGFTDGTTRPNLEVTRAEAIKLYSIAFGYKGDSEFTPTFSDVQKNDWYYPYVAFAQEHGLIEGFTERLRPYIVRIRNKSRGTTLEFSDFLIPGSSSDQVKRIQLILKNLGYFHMEPTGYFGPVTIEAIKRASLYGGTTTYPSGGDDGYYGPKTTIPLNSNVDLEIGAINEELKMLHQVFRPHQAMTRAEASKILNMLLDMKEFQHITDFTMTAEAGDEGGLRGSAEDEQATKSEDAKKPEEQEEEFQPSDQF